MYKDKSKETYSRPGEKGKANDSKRIEFGSVERCL